MKITNVEAFQVRWAPEDKPAQHSAWVEVHCDNGLSGKKLAVENVAQLISNSIYNTGTNLVQLDAGGGKPVMLGEAHPHGAWVEWLG